MEIKDSFFTIAGLLFGRGSLINPGKNCIVLYFFNTETKYLEDIKNLLLEYDPMIKKISLNSIGVDGTINGFYIVSRYGRKIKELLKLEKFHIADRIIPKTIIDSDNDSVSKFLGGLFSMNCDIEKKGYIFFRYPVIILKEIGYNAILDIQSMLKSIGIESEIENNSEERYCVRGVEKIVPSVLTVKKEQAKIFAQKIHLLNPQKRIKLEKITSSF